MMPINNSKTMSSEVNPFQEPLKRESSHSLLHISPRDKINVTTTVLRKNTSKKSKKAKNFELSVDAFSSPNKQSNLLSNTSAFPQLHPQELLMM